MATLKRRIITIPAAIVLLPVFVFLAPVVAVIGSLWDWYGKRSGQPSLRLWLYGTVWLVCEWIAIVAAALLSVLGLIKPDRAMRGYERMQGWWAGSLLGWARRLLAVNLDIQDPETMPEGQVIVVSRHASPVDAIIPAWLFPKVLGRPVHYVIKKELLWMPSIDLFGSKMGNHFVTRGGNTEAEVAAITKVGRNSENDAGLVIFPEGTYSTGPVRERVRASLRRKNETALADMADRLQHLLPPKFAGFEAFLDSAPSASVVVLGHAGLEGVAELSSLRNALPLTQDVLVRWWTTERAVLPSETKQRESWLGSEWLKLDSWLESCREGDQTI